MGRNTSECPCLEVSAKFGKGTRTQLEKGSGDRQQTRERARGDAVVEQASLARVLRRRRAVVPMSGFYEWMPAEIGGKVRRQPYYMRVDCTIGT